MENIEEAIYRLSKIWKKSKQLSNHLSCL
jgi:hypothetical protein